MHMQTGPPPKRRACIQVTGFGSPGSPASSTTKTRSCTYGLLITDTLTCHVGALMRIVEQRRDGTAPAAADLPHRRTADGRSVLQVTGRDRPAGSLFLRGSEGALLLHAALLVLCCRPESRECPHLLKTTKLTCAGATRTPGSRRSRSEQKCPPAVGLHPQGPCVVEPHLPEPAGTAPGDARLCSAPQRR